MSCPEERPVVAISGHRLVSECLCPDAMDATLLYWALQEGSEVGERILLEQRLARVTTWRRTEE